MKRGGEHTVEHTEYFKPKRKWRTPRVIESEMVVDETDFNVGAGADGGPLSGSAS